MVVEVIDAASPGIRKLGDVRLQESVDRVLAQLPSGTTAATVDVGIDRQGIQAVGIVKLKNGWSVMGVLAKHYGGTWSGKASVRWSGK